MVEHLFVYGTLAPGRLNEHVLSCVKGDWQPATVKGCLLNKGWGAVSGFPGIKIDDSGESVSGFLFSSSDLSEHWQRLDEFEGSEYRRVLAQVTLSDDATINAYVYELRNK